VVLAVGSVDREVPRGRAVRVVSAVATPVRVVVVSRVVRVVRAVTLGLAVWVVQVEARVASAGWGAPVALAARVVPPPALVRLGRRASVVTLGPAGPVGLGVVTTARAVLVGSAVWAARVVLVVPERRVRSVPRAARAA
jgi:hypothetical protein